MDILDTMKSQIDTANDRLCARLKKANEALTEAQEVYNREWTEAYAEHGLMLDAAVASWQQAYAERREVFMNGDSTPKRVPDPDPDHEAKVRDTRAATDEALAGVEKIIKGFTRAQAMEREASEKSAYEGPLGVLS